MGRLLSGDNELEIFGEDSNSSERQRTSCFHAKRMGSLWKVQNTSWRQLDRARASDLI
jgi:hypothetical protein